MGKDEWLSPPDIIEELGPFALEPSSPINRPWSTAGVHYTEEDDGLLREWFGRVWCNPPYGRETEKRLERLARHGNGIALVFARTETAMFTRQVWVKADGVMSIRGRLHFHHVDGSRVEANAGVLSVLVAYGKDNAERLYGCRITGARCEILRSK